MFKKTEDSEWSRFSKALSGQSRAGAEEAPVKEEPVEEPAPAAREPVPQPVREVVPPAPTPPPAPPRPAPSQPYVRAHHPSVVQQDTEDVETVIGPRTTFDGTLKCETNMRIKGTALGEISCAKSVYIEESARVNARVSAANTIVAGRVEGSITCEGRLEVLSTGQVTGELTAGVLIIQEGAFFEGHLKMKDRKPDDRHAAEPQLAKRGNPGGDSVVN